MTVGPGLSFGALPSFADLSPDQQAKVMEALQFNGAGMGGGDNGFAPLSGPQDPPTTGATGREAHQSAPAIAMDEAAVRRMEQPMLPPVAGGNVPPVPQAAPPTQGGPVPPAMPNPTPGPSQPAPQADPQPVNSFDPLTGQPVSGSPKAITPAGAAQATAANGGGSGLGDVFGKFLTGIKNPEVSDLLLNLGIGLMSKRGFGNGLAAGLQGYQGAQSNTLKQQLQQLQIQQQLQGQQATRAYLQSKGLSPAAVEAATLNPAILSSSLSQMNQKTPEQIQAEAAASARGSMLGGEKPIDRIQAEAQASAAGSAAGNQQPLDRIQAEAQARAAGTAEGSPDKPQYVKMKDEQGTEHVYLVDKDTGALTKPPGGPEAGSGNGNPFATGKFNSDQAKAAGFSDRMFGSEPILRKFETLNSGNALGATIAGMAPNSMKSSERQQMDQAQRDFINAQLRRESGAAISQGEFDNARMQYFPQPGDGPEVIAQKRANRQSAIEAMAREGGSSYRPKSIFDEQGNIVPFGQRQNQGMASPKTQADFDALPKGAIYIDPQDGKKYRK